jgi:hypothetical protein
MLIVKLSVENEGNKKIDIGMVARNRKVHFIKGVNLIA